MRYVHVLNTEGLKAGSMYALNRKYALNNEVHLITRVYGIGIGIVYEQNTSIPLRTTLKGTKVNYGKNVLNFSHMMCNWVQSSFLSNLFWGHSGRPWHVMLQFLA